MREWVVGGALIERERQVLLVRNRRKNGSHDWTPPGGVIDDGEELIEGLTREVFEETGLHVARWQGPMWEVEVTAEGLGWHLRAQVHAAVEFAGELGISDPDQIVQDVEYVSLDDCEQRLGSVHRWVREPLVQWLDERWAEARTFRYQVNGAPPGLVEVARL